MTSSETVRARRRAPWVDVRFLLGIVLILASVAGVWFVVSAARQTAPAIAAATTLVPGDVISAMPSVPVKTRRARRSCCTRRPTFRPR